MFGFPQPKRVVRRIDDGHYRIDVTPPQWSGFAGTQSVDLDSDQFARFLDWLHNPRLIQDALPDLSCEQRKILLSGIGPEQWDKLHDDL